MKRRTKKAKNKRPKAKSRKRLVRRRVRRQPPPKRRVRRLPKRSAARRRTVRLAPRYALDNSFEFLYELRDLVLKPSPAEKQRLVERINRLGRIKLAITAGVFMNRDHSDPTIADLLIVGDDIAGRRLRAFLAGLEAEVGKEIKLAVMEKDEFQYRLSMFDRFIRVLLESPHEKLINKLGL